MGDLTRYPMLVGKIIQHRLNNGQLYCTEVLGIAGFGDGINARYTITRVSDDLLTLHCANWSTGRMHAIIYDWVGESLTTTIVDLRLPDDEVERSDMLAKLREHLEEQRVRDI